jgi:hypothetical protein
MIGFRSRWAVLACSLLPALAWAGDTAWSLRLAAQDPVPFRGLANGDDGGKPGAMLYPVGTAGLAGLLVGIATHGAIVNSQRDSARSESEKQADKVLDPYRDSLGRFTQQELAVAALATPGFQGARLWSAQDAGGGMLLESAPLFFLTQDRDALVLDNSVSVTRPGAQPYRNTLRIVSAPRPVNDVDALKAESTNLLALSLGIVLAQADAPAVSAAPGSYRTVRYLLGKKELFERAQVLDERCGRALIRNLRGWLMSVPLAGSSANGDASCAAGAAR